MIQLLLSAAVILTFTQHAHAQSKKTCKSILTADFQFAVITRTVGEDLTYIATADHRGFVLRYGSIVEHGHRYISEMGLKVGSIIMVKVNPADKHQIETSYIAGVAAGFDRATVERVATRGLFYLKTDSNVSLAVVSDRTKDFNGEYQLLEEPKVGDRFTVQYDPETKIVESVLPEVMTEDQVMSIVVGERSP